MELFKKSSKKNKLGFTLIEMVIVIFILGIIGTVATLSFGNIVHMARLNQSANKLKEIIIYAQNLASTTGKTLYIDCKSIKKPTTGPDKGTGKECHMYEGLGPKIKDKLTFNNTHNPPGNDIWCVKDVTIRNDTAIIYQNNQVFGNCAEAALAKPNGVNYSPAATGDNLILSYTLFGTETFDEVELKFNNMFIENGGTTNANSWGKTKNTSLPKNGKKQLEVINPITKKLYYLYFNNIELYGKIKLIPNQPIIFLPGGKLFKNRKIQITYQTTCKSINANRGTEKIEISDNCI